MAMSTLLPVDARLAARTLVLDPPLTDAELEELCRANDNVRIERTREGVIHMNPPAGGGSSRRNFEINRQFGAWWATHERGEAFDSSGGFFLRDGSLLSPDTAYALPETLRTLKDDNPEGFLRLCPDFVIELLSATDKLSDAKEKMERWIANGAKLAWLVDPYARKVHIYEAGAEPVQVSAAFVHGTGPVDGFVLDVEKVWRRFRF
jgi:Uma2 family endonuclease